MAAGESFELSAILTRSILSEPIAHRIAGIRRRAGPATGRSTPPIIPAMQGARIESHTVAGLLKPERADKYLARALPGRSRSYFYNLMRQKLVHRGELRLKAADLVKNGDRLTITHPPPLPTEAEAEEIPLEILWQDARLLAVNKPSGMVTHPGEGNWRGTLVNALLGMGGRLAGTQGPLRPGIVHRLDKETSGILLVAKDDDAHRKMTAQFQTRQVKKTYLALACGAIHWEKKTVDAPIGRHPVRRTEMAVVPEGRPAVTDLEVVEKFPHFALVKASPRTGRTHQIRVHLKHLGHPIVGDDTYGRRALSAKINPALYEPVRKLKRFALHAQALEFTHPFTKKTVRIECAPPEDFTRIVALIREGDKK